MKIDVVPWILGCITAVSLVLTGCGGSKTRMETADFEKAFASADASLKGPAEDAVKAFHAGKNLEGATALANLAKSSEKMGEDQKKAVVDLVTNLQRMIAEDPAKGDGRVWQAVEDVIAALDGRESARVGVNPDRVRPPKIDGE